MIKCPDPHSCVSISVHLRSGCWSWWRDRNTCAQVTHALSRMVQTRGLLHQKSAARAAVFLLCSITRSTIYTTHTLEITQSLVCPLFVYFGSTQNMFCLMGYPQTTASMLSRIARRHHHLGYFFAITQPKNKNSFCQTGLRAGGKTRHHLL